MFAADDRVVLS